MHVYWDKDSKSIKRLSQAKTVAVIIIFLDVIMYWERNN